MFWTFLFGVVAAILAPAAEPFARKGLEGIGRSDAPLSAVDLRVVSFAACMVIAAIVSALLGNGGALTLAAGGLVGALVPKLLGF